jgi:aminoglycoside phosphotransferase
MSIRVSIPGRPTTASAHGALRPPRWDDPRVSTVGGSAGGPRTRVSALLAELGLTQPLLAVTDLGARLGVVQGVLADRILDLAVTESGRLRLRAELRGRRWAGERGIGVPNVLAAADDGRWLMSRRVHPGPAGGARWTEEAIGAAVRLAPLPPPAGDAWRPQGGGAVRTTVVGRARDSVHDAGRLVRAGVPLRELREVRTAAAQLPRAEMSHGDLRAANAVLDDGHGGMVVLEWAGVDTGPRHADLLTLWATAAGDEDRARIADAVLERTAAWEQPDVGLLWHAVALEQLVGRLTRPDRGDGLDAVFARARLDEARVMARKLDSPF